MTSQTYSVLDQFQKLVEGLGKGLKFTESLAQGLNGIVSSYIRLLRTFKLT